MAKILTGVSGGVDSGVAAALLLEQGHEVVGAYMKNWTNEENLPGDCPWEQDIVDARAVCEHLGIEFRILSLEDVYRERVVDYLLSGYEQGITPNPDVMCNREMKFGIFLEFARAQGFEYVATGHYCKKTTDDSGAADLFRGASGKDQSYFLSLIDQSQAQAAWFPMGHIPKPKVREEAKRLGLPVAEKKDSQGICFIGNIKMSDFLSHYIPENPGPIVNLEGKEVGSHQGLHLHTLGQRKGLGVPSNTFGKAYVVVAKRPEDNALVVGFDGPDTPFLYADQCTVGSLSCINRPLRDYTNLLAQPRYRSEAVAVRPTWSEDGLSVALRFEKPMRALTPGQICAFYEGNKLLGGGIFESIASV